MRSGWLVGVLLFCAFSDAAAGRTLRVLSYNIHHAEGRDGEFDLDRIASIIQAADPDIVALQELDQGTLRSGVNVFQLNELAELTGLNGYFGKTINYQGGEYGNGVLISPELSVRRTSNFQLPSPAGGERRGVLEVRVGIDNAAPDVDFSLFATHLDASNEANRLAQAAFINELVDNSSTPALLAGDLNARPSSDAIAIISDEWTDATNVSSPGIPRSSQIDYIMYRQPAQWTVVQRGRFIVNTTTTVASDHYPILAVLELRGPSADFDGDGAVDGADLLAWQRGLGVGSTLGQGDANGDGKVDGADLSAWRTQFAAGLTTPRTLAVPEPAGFFLRCVAAASVYRCSGRRPKEQRTS